MQFFQQRYNFTQDRTINENEIYLILLKSCLCVYIRKCKALTSKLYFSQILFLLKCKVKKKREKYALTKH